MSELDWPIGFSSEMIRALLAGGKTQTRRLPTSIWTKAVYHVESGDRVRFWCRETWQAGMANTWPCVVFQADAARFYPPWNGLTAFPYYDYPTKAWKKRLWIHDVECLGPWAPWIFMPRWASRLTLDVRAARYEPLQDISDADAIAEGVAFVDDVADLEPIEAYATLWDRLHDKPGKRWADNPEVAVFTLDPVHRNIDGGGV